MLEPGNKLILEIFAPEMDEVTEPLSSHGRGIRLIGRHEIRPLTKKRLRVGRHFSQVKKDDKHFDHCSLWIEQCQLYCTPPWYLIPKSNQYIR